MATRLCSLLFQYLKLAYAFLGEQAQRSMSLAKYYQNPAGRGMTDPEDLEMQLAVVRRDRDWKSEARELKEELGQARREKTCLEEKVAELEGRIDKRRRAEHQLKQRAEMVEKNRDMYRGLAKQLKRELGDSEEARKAERAEKDRELQRLTLDLDRCRRAQQDTDELLQVRTRELREAQVYLGTEDSKSHSDVLRLVERVNSFTFQASAQIADLLNFEKERGGIQESMLAPCQEVSRYIGEDMTDLLAHATHADDSIAVQLAVQSILLRFAHRAVETWDGGCDRVNDRLLEDLHKRIVASEPQPVAARWRILTRGNAWRLGREHGIHPDVVARVVNAIICTLQVSGGQVPDGTSSENIIGVIREKIGGMFAAAGELRKAIGEEVSSCEFDLIFPKRHAQFDPATMEDMDAQGRREGATKTAGGHSVLCTTEIGLSRYEGRRGTGAVLPELQATNMLKAKVALYSMVDELKTQLQPSLARG